ncbi:MAG TPA: hypothetical protein VGB18_04115 [Candidatus Thermoplasmatota archaeon]
MAIRVLAQPSSEDEVHILSTRVVSQWALCGIKVGHDWLVRHEDLDLSRSMLEFCSSCRRQLWKDMREESRAFPLQERKQNQTLWERLRAPFVDSDAEKGPEQLR